MRSNPPNPDDRRLLVAILLCAPVLLTLAATCGVLRILYRERWELQREWGRAFFALGGALTLVAAAALVLCVVRARGWRRGTWRPRSLAPLRLAFVCAVLGALVHLAFLQPFRELVAHATMCLAGGVFVLAWLSAPLVTPRLPRGMSRAADYVLFQCCLVLVLAELGLVLYARWSASRFLDFGSRSAAEEVALWRMEPGRVLRGFPCNSRGDYDEEPSTPPREHPLVVCISDSFGVGIVPHFAHFTTVAEQHLAGVEFYNLGVPAVGPREYLHLLREEALPLRPDLVVVDLFVGNDLDEEARLQRRVGRLERWLSRDQLRLLHLAGRLRRLRAEQARRAGAGPVGMGPGAVAAGRPRSREEIERMQPWLEDPTHERPTFTTAVFEELELRRARSACGPELDYSRCLQRLDQMLAVAGDVPLAVMVIPDEYQVEDALWSRILELAPGQPLDRERPQRELAAWGAARGVPLLDLLPLLRAIEPDDEGRRRVYHLQDTHFNARGNGVAGQALARFAKELLE